METIIPLLLYKENIYRLPVYITCNPFMWKSSLKASIMEPITRKTPIKCKSKISDTTTAQG